MWSKEDAGTTGDKLELNQDGKVQNSCEREQTAESHLSSATLIP